MSIEFIQNNFQAIDTNLGKLGRLMHSLPMSSAHVCGIPPVAKGDENAEIKEIPVTEHTGSDARIKAMACFQDLHIDSRYSQKAVRRSPGILWFSPEQVATDELEELEYTVATINKAKEEIRHHIVNYYTGRTARFEALRAACPGVIALHLYRQIRCYRQEDVDSISLSWLQKTSLRTPDKTELQQRIKKELHAAWDDYQVPLKQLLQRIGETPAYQLRERRRVKLQPVANFMIDGKVKTVTAPMPIIIIQDKPLQIRTLKSFDASKKRQPRSDRIQSRVLGTLSGISIEAFPLKKPTQS